MENQAGESIIDYFRKVGSRTEKIVACIPEEHLEWTIHEGRFSLGDIVRHLASIERYMYAENAR